MKRISFFTVAAIAALALTAAIGSASASAYNTVLCKQYETVCAHENILPAGSYETFAGELTLTSTTDSTNKYECWNVGFASHTTAERGEPDLPATGEYPLFAAQCVGFANGKQTSCTPVSIGKTENQGDMQFKFGLGTWYIGSQFAPLAITLSCSGGECTFTANETVYMIVHKEFETDRVKITEAPMTRTKGSFLYCPWGTSFKLDYEGRDESGTYLSQEGS